MKTIKHTLLGVLGLALMIALPAGAQSSPEEVAEAFHKAIAASDEAAVEKLLSTDVLILEGGHAQKSRTDYMASHMKADMAFIPHMERAVLDRKVASDGDLAWVTTFSTMKGNFRDRDYDFASREMLVMKRVDGAWQITLVHWADK